MKKLIVGICAILLMASFAQAQVTQVLSRNAVGYVKVIVPANGKFNMVTANFYAIGQTNMTFKQLFGIGQLRTSNNITRCDKVYSWDVARQMYNIYVQWTNPAGDFCFFTNFGKGTINPTVSPGQTLWVQSPSSGGQSTNEIYFMGEVPSVANFTNVITGNSGKPFFFIANPYPISVNVNDLINTNDGAIGSLNVTRADKMYLWDMEAQRYTILALKSTSNQWYHSTNFGPGASTPTIVLQPGQGCWYQGSNTFTWVESRPYTWPKYSGE